MILRTFSRGFLKINRVNKNLKPVDHAICIDIECTCDSPVQIHPMEVIEIACLKLDLATPNRNIYGKNHTQGVDDQGYQTFHSFVKPVINPELTLFCQDLTGITQATVDKSQTIGPVLERMFNWLKAIDLVDDNHTKKREFAFVSCGNFDFNILTPLIKVHKFNDNLELPVYFKEWINVKKTFVNHKREWPKGLYHMLELVGEEPTGRLHSAKDDCKNLARVVECLHSQGCKFYVTSRMR